MWQYLSEQTTGGLTQEFLVTRDKVERQQPFDAQLKGINAKYPVYLI
jgi:hypothetical protein